MRLLSTNSLLAIILLTGALSNGGYAQAQSNKSTQKMTQLSVSSNSSYASLHSPTFNSTVVGSPTIQLGNETFYDASQNPDYLPGQNLASTEDISEDYFVADYDSYLAASVIAQSSPTPPVDNNYYGYGGNQYGYGPYYPSLFPTASFSLFGPRYFSISLYSAFGYGIPYGGYGYYDPYGGYGYYDSFYYPNYYSSYYYPSYLNSYNYIYCPSPSVYYGGYNSYASYNNGGNTQIDNSSNRNRSSVSYYANRSYTDIRRRDNYRPGTDVNNQGGRAIADKNRSRTRSNGTNSSTYVSRRNQQGGGDVVKRRRSVAQSSGTIQNNTNAKRRYRNNTGSRTTTNNRGGAMNRNTTVNRQSRNYVSRSSSGRSTNIHRSTNRQSINNTSSRQSRSGYSSHSPSRSYSNSGSNRSSSSYRSTRSSAPSRSYSPRSSSGSSRSYSAPSRSRSSSPSRSVTRSSSSSSSRGSSSGRKH
jgi:hypothetical protein